MIGMKELSDILWTAFLTTMVAWIWLYKPPLPQGSGRNTVWIRYDEHPRKWKFYAYLITALTLCLGGVMILLNLAK